MGCRFCYTSVFKEKIGRCKTCMLQLTILSLICWPLWYIFYYEQPLVVESIALLFFSVSFTGLLLLHLLVWGYRYLILGERDLK
ncbi:DUF3624 domain-containing protein [uncultured Shewanella sp.]|uniref:DUF3624 domain-containing protein n=1 Tax=Shewanella atlantica TaxID=271099 RepID=UPI00262C9C68|nr:DUF3624 domain-containing protein [uncultured Shewanella sp.]